MLDHLKVIYYEFKARFIIQKIKYRIEGSCKKCGKCCKHIYNIGTNTKKEFDLIKKIYPKYKRFDIIDKDENGYLIFACKLVKEDGTCPVYIKRPSLCKNYPFNIAKNGAKLPEYCGFKILPEKKFEDYLNSK